MSAYNCVSPFQLCWSPGLFSTMNFPSGRKPQTTTSLSCKISTISKGEKESSCCSRLETTSQAVKAACHSPLAVRSHETWGQVPAPPMTGGMISGAAPCDLESFAFLILEQRSWKLFGRIVKKIKWDNERALKTVTCYTNGRIGVVIFLHILLAS